MVTSRRKGFTLIELLVVVAIIALLVSILLPSLARAKDLAKAVVCANNIKASYMGFTYYGNEFRGTWIAPWERTHLPPGQSNNTPYQWPYTMVHYVTGGHVSDGKAVYWTPGGFWNPEGYRGNAGSYPLCSTPDDAPQLHCPEMVARGEAENPQFYGTASFSYFIPDRWNENAGDYRSSVEYYPKPDIMTHPASTVHLMCLSGLLNESGPNVWMNYADSKPCDPHMNKSNYLFCDGHVETLDITATTERMWRDQWDPDDE